MIEVNKTVFNDKANYYKKGRLGYSEESIKKIKEEYLTEKGIIADIGSGTGILSNEFIKMGYETYCVEPNEEMRTTAEKFLNGSKNFHSIPGCAEDTQLNNFSVSLITVGTAIHWFDIEKFKNECRRILKKDGYVCILYNKSEVSESICKVNKICEKYCANYKDINLIYDKINKFVEILFDGSYDIFKFDFPLKFSKEKLLLRYLSSSFSLRKDDPDFESFEKEIKKEIEDNFKEEMINIKNDTILVVGKIK